MEYTQQFEFCSDVVKQFIETNIDLYRKDLDILFGEKSWFGSFFNCDLTMLANPTVHEQFVQSCEENTTDVPRQHDAILARVKSLYVSLSVAVGRDAIQKMTANCIESVYSMIANDPKKEKDPKYRLIRTAFAKCPFILIAALGAPYYSSRRVEYIMTNGLRKRNTLGKALGSSQPSGEGIASGSR